LTDGDRHRADGYEALELVIGDHGDRTRAILPHTDNPYRDPVPTVQLLHCLSTADDGGHRPGRRLHRRRRSSRQGRGSL
jgi:hypothetical protein